MTDFQLPEAATASSLIFLLLFTLYKVIPPTKVHAVHASLAAGIATVGLIVAKDIYQAFTVYMITYNKVYGSLASVPTFLMWLLILWQIVLGGAIVAASIKRRQITADKLGLKLELNKETNP